MAAIESRAGVAVLERPQLVPETTRGAASAGLERQRPFWTMAVLAAGLVAMVYIRQWATGAYATELATHPDEPAHFTTAVMVFDYLRSGGGEAPMPFAERFYAQYPKVALGHWPPVFYVVLAGWYALFGVSIGSALALAGAITALTAVCLFLRLRSSYGIPIALLTATVFVNLPLVVRWTAAVMSDMLLGLFCLLAVFQLGNYLQAKRPRSLAWYVVWASLALLTKGTGIILAPLTLLAVIFSGHFEVLRRKDFWIAGMTVGLLTVPFYLATISLGLHGHPTMEYLAEDTARFLSRLHVLELLVRAGSPVLFAVGGLGAFHLLRRPPERPDARRHTDLALAVAWLVALVGFHVFSPITGETRYFLPALLPLGILFARGLSRLLEEDLQGSRQLAKFSVVAAGILAIVMAPEPLAARVTGYAPIAEAIPFHESGGGPVVLVSSDPRGEGVFLVQRLIRDRTRSSVVLRASKLLADAGWSGWSYSTRHSDPGEIAELLDRLSVHYIVIDDSDLGRGGSLEHQHLLDQAVRSHPQRFRLIGRYGTERGEVLHKDAVRLYENMRARGRMPERIEIDLERSLGRRIDVRL